LIIDEMEEIDDRVDINQLQNMRQQLRHHILSGQPVLNMLRDGLA